MAFEKVIRKRRSTAVSGMRIAATGWVTISVEFMEQLDNAKFVAFMVDKENKKIAVQPSNINDPYAYTLKPSTRTDGSITSYRCMTPNLARKIGSKDAVNIPTLKYSISEEAFIGAY